MAENRFFVDSPLIAGSVVRLDARESHHLRVMRSPEKVELINGQGFLAQAHPVRDGLEILSVEKGVETHRVVLCQALPRMNRLDMIVEKGTEIGMRELWLFPGERSERETLSNHQRERVQHLMQAALKQCGRLYLPTIRWMTPLVDWERPSGQLLYGKTHGGSPFPLLQLPVYFFVGPEAGFSPAEEAHLMSWDAWGVTLNSATLRTDTAALVALALIAAHIQ